MHLAVEEWVKRWAPEVPVSVIDVGGRDVNGTTRHLFHPACSWTVVDPQEGENVDVVADFTIYEHPTKVDVILCTEVAEHFPGWPGIVATARRTLKDSGLFIFTAAGEGRPPHSAVEAVIGLLPGEHYANIRRQDLMRVLEANFTRWVTDVQGADIRAVAWCS